MHIIKKYNTSYKNKIKIFTIEEAGRRSIFNSKESEP